MTAQTKLSAEGRVSIPQDVRDRLGWREGSSLEIVETPEGVMLRRPAERKKLSLAEATRQLREIYQHKGPPLPIERLSWSAEVDEEFERSRK